MKRRHIQLVDSDGNDAGPIERPAKIAIAVPTHEMVPATFAFDLANLLSWTSAQVPPEVEVATTYVAGTYVHRARQDILDYLLSLDVTHILWLDSDMRFPREALLHLMSHDLDFVGINYAQRTSPPDFVGIKRMGGIDDAGERLVTNTDSTGLESVDALGFGCFMMRTSALARFPEDAPWFWYDLLPDGRHIGEDVYFCRLAREAGYEIYCDHDLSHLCSHTGSFDYRCGHAETMTNEGVV